MTEGSKRVLSVVRGRSNAWPAHVRERAREIWSSSAGARSAARTEYLMMQEAKADAGPDAYVLDRVPPVSTIKDWVREDGWRDAANKALLATIDEDQTDHDVQMFYVRLHAVETLALCQAGAYDHDPKLLMSKMKEVEMGLRLTGAGTFGNQFGGRTQVPIGKLSDPGGAGDDRAVDPREEARLMRERMVSEKGTGGGTHG